MNAEKFETLYYNLENIEDEDLSNLDSVKKLNLQVKKDLTIKSGLKLSTENYDKDLSIENLVEDLFNKNREKICNLLF